MSKGVKYQCREGIKYYPLWNWDAQELINNFETWKQYRYDKDPMFKIIDEGSRVRVAREILEREKTHPPDCDECDGTGFKIWMHRESTHHSSGSKTICPKCKGTGKKILTGDCKR